MQPGAAVRRACISRWAKRFERAYLAVKTFESGVLAAVLRDGRKVGDDWSVNWADVPSVLRLDDGTLAAYK